MRNDTAGKGRPRRYPVRASEGRAQGAPVKGGSVGEARRAPCVSQKVAEGCNKRCWCWYGTCSTSVLKRKCAYKSTETSNAGICNTSVLKHNSTSKFAEIADAGTYTTSVLKHNC